MRPLWTAQLPLHRYCVTQVNLELKFFIFYKNALKFWLENPKYRYLYVWVKDLPEPKWRESLISRGVHHGQTLRD